MAKQLVRELQAALDAQPDGADMWVDMRSYDEPEEYGLAEGVSTYVKTKEVNSLQTFVITYN